MKYLLISLLSVIVITTSGCGTIIGMRADAAKFDMKATSVNTDVSPVKSDVFKQVQTITVADFSGLLGEDYPTDNKRLYRAMINELAEMLKETGRFKVVEPKEFRQEVRAQDIDFDMATAELEELHEEAAAVGKAMSVHAVAVVGLETIGDASSMSAQLKHMGSLIVDGSISIPVAATFEFVRTRKPEVLWSQASNLEWVSGTQGLKSTNNSELRSIMRKVLNPMVKQMLEKHAS